MWSRILRGNQHDWQLWIFACFAVQLPRRLEAFLTRTTAAGTCSITFEVRDKWGAIGRPTVTIDVATLKVLSHSNPASMQVVCHQQTMIASIF